MLDDILEIVFDLLFDAAVEVAGNKKVHKWVRYPLLALVIFLTLTLTVGTAVLGVLLLRDSLLAGLLLIALAVALTVILFLKARRHLSQ